jgi:hypothetical protein
VSATAGLTAVQQQMFITQGMPVYRLPMVFPVPDGTDGTEQELCRAVRTALASCPTLCARYLYDTEQDDFLAVHDPALARELRIADAGEIGDVEEFCRRGSHQPDLATGGPVTATLATWQGQRMLLVEFHHIAIDGIGVALFERLVRGDAVPGLIDDPERAFAVYDEVARRERESPHVTGRSASLRDFLPSDVDGTGDGGAALGRVTARLRPEQVATIRASAARRRVFPRILLQAAFEDTLAGIAPGMHYSCAKNWRWSVGARAAVGTFPAMVDHRVREGSPLGPRVEALMGTDGSPEIAPDERLDDRPAVVFSFEQFGFRTCRFVPVDEHPRFELYVRVALERDECLVQAEYDRRVVPDRVAEAVVRTTRRLAADPGAGSRAEERAESKAESNEETR